MFDVFISYSHQDAEWVHTLAGNLHRAGLDVFLDEWEISPGDLVVQQLERGLLSSRSGLLVISPASVSRPWVQQEYAVLVGAAVEGKQRLIPVLLGDVEVPPFAASRLWVDFRGADGPEYQRRVSQLVAALRGERPQRPPRDGQLVVPPRSGLRPEGARRVVLRISLDHTVLTAEGGEEVAGRPAGPSHRLEEQVWQVGRARSRALQTEVLRTAGKSGKAEPTMHQRLVELGTGLTKAFLPEPVRTALAEHVRLASDGNAALRLAVEVTEPGLADLPWETLCLPEVVAGPLALHPRVELYRAVAGLGPTPAIQIPGPLRILVAIGSPDQGERGELLDYEAELRRILDAVDPARRQDRADVRILNRGTVAEIRAALQVQRFHVLHISCHARPGALILEDEDGRPDEVTAKRLADEVLTADRGVPLVVLAGCSTALTKRTTKQPMEDTAQERDGSEQGEAALPGLARQLLGHGVPAVLAMNAPVTDAYATRLSARLYQELATQERPDPLAAVAEARRQVDTEVRKAAAGSREARLAELAEWATPVLAVRGPSLPLFDPTEPFEPVQARPEPRLAPGIAVRRVGDFVGRRQQERLLLTALQGQQTGVVIRGIGGIGKSTLAAQLVADLGERAGLVVSLVGKVTVDQILDEMGRRLLSACLATGLDEAHPLRQLSSLLREPKVDWTDRLDLLGDQLLRRQPVLLLLDNFEDNLQPVSTGGRDFELVDPELGRFLTAWVRARDMRRLLVTSRYLILLPDGAQKRLEVHHLGPLSLAETRKLVWRLPGLDQLEPGQLQRAYADVGGHPRALEYLDALLRGGQGRFDDITERLERALAAEDIDDPTRWHTGVAGDLDRALAETISLTVNDVLLGQLLHRLDDVPLARRLLLGVSVYRRPVDEHGVAWQVAEEVDQHSDKSQHEGRRRIEAAAEAAEATGQQATPETLGLPEDEVSQPPSGLAEAPPPPLDAPKGLKDALTALAQLGLVAPADSRETTAEPAASAWIVHRWTAAALAQLAAKPELDEAHRRAASYWRWRITTWPQDAHDAIALLLEVRYHHQAAGDLNDAVEVTAWVVSQLDTWGAWSWAERLCQETLKIVPRLSFAAAIFTQDLGKIAHKRRQYDQALAWYRQALAIQEEIGDRLGMGSSYHQFGMIAQEHGEHDQALDWFRKALAIFEELGDRAEMGRTYHQLGVTAQEREQYDEAETWFRQALAIFKDLGDRSDMARSYHQLGTIAQLRGNDDEALDWFRRSLTLKEELGDRRGMATSYHHLGLIAQEQGEYDQALGWYRRSLTISEELGDRVGMAHSYFQLGIVAQDRNDYKEARKWFRRSLAIGRGFGNRRDMARSYLQLGITANRQGQYDLAVDWYRRSLALSEEVGDRHAMARLYGELGAVAGLRGDSRQALVWFRQALTLFEELKDRLGMAYSSAEVGSFTALRGDFDQALDRLRQALTLFEELGERGGTATVMRRIGALFTETGRLADGRKWNLRSLRIYTELRDQHISNNLRLLQRQRTLLGIQRFQRLVRQELGDRESQNIMKLLQQLPGGDGE